jgi:monoamine oxidase
MEAGPEGGGGGDQVQAPGGLRPLVRSLAERLPPGVLRPGFSADAVACSHDLVTVRAAAPGRTATFRARHLVATLPPPALSRLLPTSSLPTAHRLALSRLRMGAVVKLGLRFRTPVRLHEEDSGDPAFFNTHRPFPTWWRGAAGPTTLVAWAGGPAALALQGVHRSRLVRLALAQLAALSHQPEARLADALTGVAWRDWTADPLAGGAYAYALVGGARASDTLQEPVDRLLFLAGEATSDVMGTVDGAWVSGRRAARQVLREA